MREVGPICERGPPNTRNVETGAAEYLRRHRGFGRRACGCVGGFPCVPVCTVCVPAPCGVFLPVRFAHRTRIRSSRGPARRGSAGASVGCPCVPFLSRVPCVSRLPRCLFTVCVPAPPVSFYRVCPGSPRCLFTGKHFVESCGFGRRADVRGVCCWWVSMVVRFVCVVCVPLCVRVFRVSRVCPGSPRCLFTG